MYDRRSPTRNAFSFSFTFLSSLLYLHRLKVSPSVSSRVTLPLYSCLLNSSTPLIRILLVPDFQRSFLFSVVFSGLQGSDYTDSVSLRSVHIVLTFCLLTLSYKTKLRYLCLSNRFVHVRSYIFLLPYLSLSLLTMRNYFCTGVTKSTIPVK